MMTNFGLLLFFSNLMFVMLLNFAESKEKGIFSHSILNCKKTQNLTKCHAFFFGRMFVNKKENKD